jgi:hypothetical protein
MPLSESHRGEIGMAIAAKHDVKVFKTDTKQAFMYGEIGDEEKYIRAPDWWPNRIRRGKLCYS